MDGKACATWARWGAFTLCLALGACTSSESAPPEGGESTSAEIGPDGGTLETDDGALRLEVPAGALSSMTTLTAEPLPPPDDDPDALPDTRYELGPDGTEFAEPVTLTLRYDVADLPDDLTPEEEPFAIAVVRDDGDVFVAQPSINDVDTGTVSATLEHFTPYHATYETSIVLPPMELRVTNQTSDSIELTWQLQEVVRLIAGNAFSSFPSSTVFAVEIATGSQSPPQTEDRFRPAGSTRAYTRAEMAAGPLVHTVRGLRPEVDDRFPGSQPQSFFTFRVRAFSSGNKLGQPSTQATGFLTPGSGGTGGTGGGTGGMGGGGQACPDDLGGPPAMTAQPSASPTPTVALGDTMTFRAPVNAATKFVRAVVTNANTLNAIAADVWTTTNGAETVELQAAITGTTLGDFFVIFYLCESQAECFLPAATLSPTTYQRGGNMEPEYLIVVGENGQIVGSEFSTCANVIEVEIVQ